MTDTLDQLIAAAELADELNTHRGTLLKIAKRMGLDPLKRCDVDRGNQQISVLRQADADRIRAELANSRRSGGPNLEGDRLSCHGSGNFLPDSARTDTRPGTYQGGIHD